MEKKKNTADTASSDKKKALETALQQIEKNFGKGTVMRLGDKPEMVVDAIPTGSLALDGHRRRAARQNHRDLRAGVIRQDDSCAAHRRAGTKAGRRGRVC